MSVQWKVVLMNFLECIHVQSIKLLVQYNFHVKNKLKFLYKFKRPN